MAQRTVKVDTVLGAGAKEGMEQLGFKVKEVDGQVDRLNRDLKQTADETAKAAATMELLKVAASGAGDKVDAFGKKRTVLEDLDTAIVQTQGRVRALGDEFNRTGNADIFRDLRKAKADLKDLENLGADLKGAMETGGKEAGRTFLQSFGSAIQGVLSTPVLGPLSVALIAAITALLLPAINGAFIALGTMGGIATGVVGQLKDPRVQAAIKDFGTSFMTEFKADTSSFAEPIMASLQTLLSTLKGALRSIDFGALSKDLQPLIDGIGDLVTELLPGFNKMLASSGPIMHEVNAGLHVLGVSLSMMFDLISKSGPGAVEGLRLLFGMLGGVLVSLGAAVFAASQAFHYLLIAIEFVAGMLDKLFGVFEKVANNPVFKLLAFLAKGVHDAIQSFREGASDVNTLGKSLDTTGGSANKAAIDFDKLAGTLSQTKNTADSLQAAMAQKLFTQIINVDQAILGWNKSLLDLHDTLDKNHQAIDKHTGLVAMNTRAGIENREAVLAAMTANMQQYQAFIAAGGAADVATRNYDHNTAALEAMLHKAHFSQKAIDDMIGSLRSVPGKTQTEIAMYGLTEAINRLGYLLAELNHLNGSSYGFTVTDKHVYETDYITHQQGEHKRWGGIYQHAAAGLLDEAKVYSATDPGRFVIAEPATGGEAFIPRLGDYNRSTGILDQAARWYGGRFVPAGGMGGQMYAPVYHISVNALDARAAGTVVIEAIKSYERSNGTNWRTSP